MSSHSVPQPNRTEMRDITICKGLGILLVVVGHILSKSRSEGNEWFVGVTDHIYLFHMAFFMFLSGFVFFAPGRMDRLRHTYAKFVKNQTVRLLIPFVALGLFVLILKLLAQPYAHVDNAPTGFWDGVLRLFWYTEYSPSEFIWYIFVLFAYGVISPWLAVLLGERYLLWVAVGLLLYLVPPIEYLYLDKLTHFFVFFAFGGFFRQHFAAYIDSLDRYWPVYLLIFALLLLTDLSVIVGRNFQLLIVGVFSIPALHSLCRVLLRHEVPALAAPLYVLGKYTLVIYLFNTLAIGFAKAVIFAVADWNHENFYWAAPVLVLSGILIPIAVQKLVLNRVSFIRERILL